MTERKLRVQANSLDRGDLIEDPSLPYKDGPHYVLRKTPVAVIEGSGPDRTPGWILLEFGSERIRTYDEFDTTKSKNRIVVEETRVMTLVLK